MNFESVIDKIIDKETVGFVHHPSDRGGATNTGITEAVARDNGYEGPMETMHETHMHLIKEIYRNRYIVAPWFDKVAAIDARVGMELIDTGVLMGPGKAAIFFQEWLNVFNLRGKVYADLFVDGRIRKITLDAFHAFCRHRGNAGPEVMLYALNCTQGNRFKEIAEASVSQEDFVYGWMLQRVVNPLKELQNEHA